MVPGRPEARRLHTIGNAFGTTFNRFASRSYDGVIVRHLPCHTDDLLERIGNASTMATFVCGEKRAVA